MPKILERDYPPMEANDNVYFMRRVGFEYVPVRFVRVKADNDGRVDMWV